MFSPRFPLFDGSECWEAFNATKPPKEKCSQCGESLSSIDGKFSGSFVQLDGGPKLHGTWWFFGDFQPQLCKAVCYSDQNLQS